MARVGHNVKMEQLHVETTFWYGFSFSVLYIVNYMIYCIT
jgi:hypothetical protein